MSCKKTIPELVEGEWVLVGYSSNGIYTDIENENHLYNFRDKNTYSISQGPTHSAGYTISGNYRIKKLGEVEFDSKVMVSGTGSSDELDLEVQSLIIRMKSSTISESELRFTNKSDYVIFSKN
ncbi:MAG: hypothetical protein ACI837_002518 [Crocinitomicaceae bacterium]|jgi:hypothetical protein